MKKLLFIALLILLIRGISFAQLTGTKTIPGNYSSIAAAISALNTQGVGNGGVTFNIAAGYTETFASNTAGLITTPTGSAANPILFQRSGTGPNPVITAAALAFSSLTDGIIILQGTDYVTFNGIDVKENPLNTTEMTEWGYAILMASATDASQHITIKNCNISLNSVNQNTRGVFSKNQNSASINTITPTSTNGVVSYCDIDGCNISNVYEGISFIGYDAPAPYTLCSQMNRFGYNAGNTITNFGGTAPYAVHGIYTVYQNNLVVANNTINNGTMLNAADIFGIKIGSAHVANVDIYKNVVTITNWAGGITTLYGILNAGSSAPGNNNVNIYQNIIENCSQPTSTGSIWFLLWNTASAGIANIHDNIIRNNSRPAFGGETYMISLYAAQSIATENVYKNEIYGNTTTGPEGLNATYCLFCNDHSLVKNIHDNDIHDNTTNGTKILGIYTSNYEGIDAGTVTNVSNNKIYNQTISSSVGINYGLRINGGDITYAYNNLISDLNAPLSAGNASVRGISIESGNSVGLFNNSLFINESSTGANFGTACVYSTATSKMEMRNNLLVNASTSNGTGITTAFTRYEGIHDYNISSGHNDFYAGTPGPNNLIFSDGTTSYQSLSDFKSLMSPGELFSFTEMPPFVNTTTTPYDLHINSSSPTQCESGGSIVTTPVNIPSDFDNAARYPNSGYPNNPGFPATAPDAGAFEFAGIHSDLAPPDFTYTPLQNTSILTNRTLTVTINDGSGVPASGSGLPVCYWKINSGPYTAAQGVKVIGTDDYTFSFGGGVSLGDVVSYYLVAQDIASPPNIGANPSVGTNGFSANPPACSTPTSAPRTYTVIQPISGVITIGTGGTYPTLTGTGGLFQDIRNKVLTSDLTVKIISNLTEPGTYSLNKWIEDLPGSFTLTIQPDAATERLIEGNYSGCMIRFTGAENAIIDGRFNGAGKYLRFRNNNTGNGDFEFTNDARYNTLRDCYWESGNTASTNTNGGVIRFYTSTGTDGNSNNSLINNVICNLSVGTGIPTAGIFSYGSSNAVNSNNLISGNEILNFKTYGIYVSTGNGSNWVISGNSFYNNLSTALTSTLRCIYFDAEPISNGNIIQGNYIGGTSPTCGGTPWVLNLANGNNLMGIWVSAGSDVPTEIYNNVITNIHYKSTGTTFFYGIDCSSGVFHIGNLGGNVVGSDTVPESIAFEGTNAFRGIIYLGANLSTIIENNLVGNISWANASGSQSAIHGLSIFAATVRNNKVIKIGTSLPGFIPTIYGIYNNGVTGYISEYSNNIVDLDGGAATNPTIYGFYDNSGAFSGSNLYYNTINIHGPATTFSSTFAFRRLSGSSNILKNNIFLNSRAAGGVGVHYALYNVVASSNFSSDYNDLYCPSGQLGYSGGTNYASLSAWQSATSGDIHSVSMDPVFTSALDLHPTNLAMDNSGVPIPGITLDYDGILRGSPPDLGAFEFNNFKNFTVKLFLEGLYNGAEGMNQAMDENGPHFPSGVADHITLEFHNPTNGATEFSINNASISTSGIITGSLSPAFSGSYYLYVKHRNSVTTSSFSPVSFAGSNINYDFSTGLDKAFGNNMKLIGGVAVLYAGDVNQDGNVDSSDMIEVDNDNASFSAGYLTTDVEGSGAVDATDLIMVDNNNASFIGAILPF